MRINTLSVLHVAGILVAGGALVASLVFSGFLSVVQADHTNDHTLQQLLERIAVLEAQLAARQSGIEGVPAGYTWTRNLTLGSTGEDVRLLQVAFNASVNTRVAATGPGSPGNETMFFGPLTRDAALRFQNRYRDDILTPLGLTQATGFVGPSTRAKLNELAAAPPAPAPAPTPSPDPDPDPDPEPDPDLPAVEGRVSASRLATPGNQIEGLRIGQTDRTVLGVGIEALDSRMQVRRVDVELETGMNERTLARLLDDISLVVAGETIARTAVTRDNLIDIGSNRFQIRLFGFNEAVSAGSMRNFQVRVSVSDNEGDHDDRTIAVRIPRDGIRAVDQAGLNQFNPSATAARTFSVEDRREAEVTVRSSDEDPDERVILANETSGTSDVRVFAFDLEVDNHTVEIFDIGVGLEMWDETGTTVVTPGQANNDDLDEFLSNVKLVYDGAVVGTELAEGESDGNSVVTVIFDSLDIELADGRHTFLVEVDLRAWDTNWEGYTIRGSVDGSTIMGEDVDGDDITISGSIEGETHPIFTVAPELTRVSRSLVANDDNDQATGSMNFTVTARGGDIFIHDETGIVFDAQPADGVVVSTYESPGTTKIGDFYRIREGQTRTFETGFVINDGTQNAFYRVIVDELRWNTSATTTGETVWEYPDFGLENLRTGQVFLQLQ